MWKKILFAISIVVGLGAFCAIPFIVGIDKTRESIERAGILCIGVYFLVCTLTWIFPAIGWWILLRAEGVKISLPATIRTNFMGFPINFCTPSMYLGSEPLRLFYVARISGADKRRILATMIVNKFQELMGLVMIGLAAALYFVWSSDIFPQSSETLIVVATGVLAVLMVLLFFAFVGNFKPTVRFINLLARLGVAKRKIARLRSRAEEMEQMVRDAFVKRWRRFIAAQLFTLGSSIGLFLRPVVFFWFLYGFGRIPLEHVCALYVITNLIAMLNIVPGGLGIYEGGIVGYFVAAGLGDQDGVALTLVNRISDIGLLVIGGWLLMHYGMMAVASGKEKVDMPEMGHKDEGSTPSEPPAPSSEPDEDQTNTPRA